MRKRMHFGVGMVLTLTLALGNPGIASVYAAQDQEEQICREDEEGTVSGSDGQLITSKNGKNAARDDENVPEWKTALDKMVAEREIMAVVYMKSTYAVKETASENAKTVCTLYSGQTVYIEDAEVNDLGEVWEYVRFQIGTKQYHGYIKRENLACADERFLEWERVYGGLGASQEDSDIPVLSANQTITNKFGDINQFPASYQSALNTLKKNHPNWIFVPMNTGLNWNTVISEEMKNGRSLIHKSQPDYMKQGAYDGGNWFYATEGALRYYMDPRNALTENAIFQFEQLTYNETYHTEEAVSAFLNNTFMRGNKNAPGTEMTYAHIIWSVGQEEGRKVSPFHLAARIYQEQGAGTSPLISGTYPGYEGYYNYFNVRASGTTNEQVIRNGLQYAKEQGWSDAYRSIAGGADVISANYIKKGQDTLYLQKFNVNPQGGYALYTHQYMQNIMAPTTEASSIRKLYAETNSLDNTYVFKIPVYNNMPSSSSSMPTAATDIVIEIPDGFDKIVYVDGVAYPTTERNGKYIISAGDQARKTIVAYKYDASNVPVGMYVWTLEYTNGQYTATSQPDLQNLLTYHGFSVRIAGESGIRFKTGISVDVRNRLTSGGINGYKLKEYGTLTMRQSNRATYPMIKGGEKVVSGLSYGTDTNGAGVDRIFETVDGRYRYTSVLIGQPVSEYKTEYSFRGYIVLEKNGQQITLYGPPVAKSIYSLAKQLVEQGVYAKGTDADTYLRKLISDADSLGN